MKSKGFIIVLIILALLLISGGVYTVDETEQVVVTQFGKVVDEDQKNLLPLLNLGILKGGK